jgi:hypothetical protein
MTARPVGTAAPSSTAGKDARHATEVLKCCELQEFDLRLAWKSECERAPLTFNHFVPCTVMNRSSRLAVASRDSCSARVTLRAKGASPNSMASSKSVFALSLHW